VTPFGTIELTVYPYECDSFGHLNQAALLTLLERARWDALARGPGMDLFDRISFWRTPVSDCGGGRTCVPYHEWVTAYIAVIGGR